MSSTPTQDELPVVLLAEDSKTAAVLIARHLKGLYNVVHAYDGTEAWNTLSANPAVDLVITDVQMPGMTGHELLVKIRSSDVAQIKNVPVIVMTSAEESAERDLAFANGANDFLTKPVDKTELQARASVHKKLTGTTRELATNRQTLQEQATTDPLTQLKNRRAFSEIAETHLALARRHRQDLSVIVLAIDHFKKIHDTRGPAAADATLAELARILATNTRTEDATARISDDELAILLPNTNRLGAAVLAERIRGAVENKPFAIAGTTLAATVSVAVASYNVGETTEIDALLQVAGKRLAVAKQSGGNRIVAADG